MEATSVRPVPFMHALSATHLWVYPDVGNGEYQPAFQQGAPGAAAAQQPNYGATGGGYVH